MTPKDLFIALCFLASATLVVFGGWNYMKGRINQAEENEKVVQLAKRGYDYDAEEVLQKIRRAKTNSLIMFAVGVTGLFLIITRASRQRRRISSSVEQTIKKYRT